MMNESRQSNFEILRIVAMLFIIIHHHLQNITMTCGYSSLYNYDRDGFTGILINSFVVGGVNLFVMISGYFGIRHVCNKLLKIFIDVFVYSSLSYMASNLFTSSTLDLHSFFTSIDFRYYWFVTNYAILVLFSPILEAALKNQRKEKISYWIILLLIINVIFGFIFEESSLLTGYNFSNFFLLYLMARYIRLAKEDNNKIYKHFSTYGWLYWIISAILLALGLLVLSMMNKVPDSKHYFGYNNPLILFYCFCLFACFSKYKLNSKLINTISTGMFGVYLIHTSASFCPIWIKFSSSIYNNIGYIGIFISSLIILVILSPLTIVIEKMTSKLKSCIVYKL